MSLFTLCIGHYYFILLLLLIFYSSEEIKMFVDGSRNVKIKAKEGMDL